MTRSLAGLLLCCLLAAACVPGLNTRDGFEKSLKNFNGMLRWNEPERAGVSFLAPELRAEFDASVTAMQKNGVTITDYRVLSTEYRDESADALVEFDYYVLPSNRIRTMTCRQQWVYRELQGTKGWRLAGGLPQFK